jgi:bacterioferritin-associated ferredoxin
MILILIYYLLVIICSCQNINSKTLDSYLQKGYSLDEIIQETNITQECGSCLTALKDYQLYFEQIDKPILATALA